MCVCVWGGGGGGRGVRVSEGREEARVNLNMLDAMIKHSQSSLSSALPFN